MKKFLIFLAIFELTSAVCVSKTLTFCQYGFNQNLNVTSSTSDWTNPGTLSFIIRSYYIQGIDGLLSVCSARQQFVQCLGDQYDQCMSPLNFISTGSTPDDAQAYVSLFKTMEFDCNGGFIQSSRNWPCIATILQTRDAQLNTCRQSYQDAVKKSPSSLCQSSADYETCVRNQYSNTCGAEVSWWSCERTRRGLSIDQDCPMDSCNLVAASINESIDNRAKAVFDRKSDFSMVLKELADKH